MSKRFSTWRQKRLYIDPWVAIGPVTLSTRTGWKLKGLWLQFGTRYIAVHRSLSS